MGKRPDWVRSVMFPMLGAAALVGATVGGLLGWMMSGGKPDLTPLEGAVCGAFALAGPTWVVLWVFWAVRRPWE